MDANESFSRVATYAKIKKFETGEGGRKITIEGFSLSGGQFEFIDSLAAGQKEVLLQIVNSSRGTLFNGQDEVDLSARVTKDAMALEVDAIGLLILKTASEMRTRMLEKFNDGVTGWDDETRLAEYEKLAKEKVKHGDWLDAMNYIAIILNLQKPIAGEITKSEADAEPETPLLDNMPSDEPAKEDTRSKPEIEYLCKKCNHQFTEPKVIKGGKAVCPQCKSARIEAVEFRGQ